MKRIYFLHPLNMAIVLTCAGILTFLMIRAVLIYGYIAESYVTSLTGILINLVFYLTTSYRIEVFDGFFKIKWFIFTLISVQYEDILAVHYSFLALPTYAFGYRKTDQETAMYVLRIRNEKAFFRLIHEKAPNCDLDSKIRQKLGIKVKLTGS